MKISVIIPVYNVAAYLARGLDCVLAQSHSDLEIICVDDGSTDESAAILRDFAGRDGRIKIIAQANAGAAAARNTGLAAATGDWVHFFDPDDEIPSDYYAQMLAADDGADIIAGGFIEEGKREIIYESMRTVSGPHDKFAATKVFFRGFVWRYLFRRTFLAAHNLRFPDFLVCEDLLFSIEAVGAAKKIALAPNARYFYRKNPTSCINTPNPKKQADYDAAAMLLEEFATRHGLRRHLIHGIGPKIPFFGITRKKKIRIK